ncbi:DUF2971 domain-containing protein [Vibrio parahaemolyticus]|uniref:DUF2971 domain-containing protein n=2 Tax=Vibrionaceae TaxID=641 RepID=UPI0004D3EE32|nr:DUF2971 domain-containing protein [Vibrio parahaemolyticus]AVW95469.1 DUF2971 domain-containing protein [Vibrio parahaemolyticus]EGQ8739742.1 DUF2971 domain-containing protein [Vibrio parahaemolyticus]EGQ8907579.1 DUF2971 domain-containing protein [Vibrio parahaemolyticus]EGR3101504.1 DUF2971 domain-containing protein [Vibrio parahaemolyticus]EHY0996638.1 DUF2971 domain-containing protein [Vibrio parahaemolyticus]
MKAYKFRSSEQMSFVFDILFNQKLFCAEWHTLNDPVEGVAVYTGSSDSSESVQNFMEKVERAKTPLRVCSLSKTFDEHLLWAHYAGGFSGLAIEFEIDPGAPEVVDMEYRGVFANVNSDDERDPNSIAKEVLSSKYSAWSYEKEVRILTTDTFYKLKHPITRVIVGHRMSQPLFDALRIVCEKLDIEVCRIAIGDEGLDADWVPRYGEKW